ncbi:hypothetical protein MES5069_450011 [Mesorhizobium escarrei]|uniref:Uncharacterized protein n=1 Tax=Mesorhizobium escarrei TaxID=666018 RepID=A0ABM9E7A2_9HYPH|nr:hypothetical protein MES5069_450011 [Mesorhizobium escarrei]
MAARELAARHDLIELGDQRRAPLLAQGVVLGRRQAVDRALNIEQGMMRFTASTASGISVLRRHFAQRLTQERCDLGSDRPKRGYALS